MEDWKRDLLDFIGKGKKWDVRGGARAGFESLALMTDEGIEKEVIAICWTNWDLGVVEILGPENFEWEKERCEAEFVKELDFSCKNQNYVFEP